MDGHYLDGGDVPRCLVFPLPRLSKGRAHMRDPKCLDFMVVLENIRLDNMIKTCKFKF